MRLLTLPITIVRVPIELGFGAAKEAVKFAHGLVSGGEEQVEEKQRPAAPPRRRRTSSRAGARSGNGRARSRAARGRSRRPAEEAMKAAPPIDEPASAAATAPATGAPTAGEASTEEAAPRPGGAAAPAGEAAPAARMPAADAPPPEPVASPLTTDVPTHVDEEPELVAETAETGAEDGAGAEVDVDEPWPGYDAMTVPDIEERLQAEGPEAAAAVSLYEASRKGRASILEVASRSMV